ncbi:diaminopimelate decarboxylase [Cellulomonas sp. JZ18]|uniref:diaminopimelate decarboxylase n=1 Tax=Cellulomonas sp. JZ18 TaxID=2654191 RepID=UPI0012D40216|nr:diaminopimelate decarboxylase [Cellulomonas sp. JZ18]QGQ18359.1 diaminopimelate decarboxylase [Cellulomonas sp. JZ18]
MHEQLTIQGVPVADIVAVHGSPTYVYDGEALTQQYQRLRDALPAAVDVFYSLKANPNVALTALLVRAGAGAEVSSLTELRTALRAGVDPADVIFLGPGKSDDELRECCELGVRAVVVESLPELARLDAVAGAAGRRQPVLLRVNPDFQVKGSGLTMGGKARQFGVDVDQAVAAGRAVGAHEWARVVGVHVYMGTRILAAEAVVENTERILALAERVAEACGIDLEVVDVGGGLGVPYFPKEDPLDLDVVGRGVRDAVERFRARHPRVRMILESGRYLVAECGTYVLGVRYVKESFGERFAVADGGTNHHMAAVGIGSVLKRNFPMGLVGRASTAPTAPWHLTGPLCTPADELGKNVDLPSDLRPGDLVGVFRSGAYGPTASPVHFLSHGYPAEVLVHDGEVHLVRHRDTPEDMLRQQVLPTILDPVTTDEGALL